MCHHCTTHTAPATDRDAQLAEQHHQLDEPDVDTAFALLAIDHPDRCTPQEDPAAGT